jgi:hypothetical protein
VKERERDGAYDTVSLSLSLFFTSSRDDMLFFALFHTYRRSFMQIVLIEGERELVKERERERDGAHDTVSLSLSLSRALEMICCSLLYSTLTDAVLCS